MELQKGPVLAVYARRLGQQIVDLLDSSYIKLRFAVVGHEAVDFLLDVGRGFARAIVKGDGNGAPCRRASIHRGRE